MYVGSQKGDCYLVTPVSQLLSVSQPLAVSISHCQFPSITVMSVSLSHWHAL